MEKGGEIMGNNWKSRKGKSTRTNPWVSFLWEGMEALLSLLLTWTHRFTVLLCAVSVSHSFEKTASSSPVFLKIWNPNRVKKITSPSLWLSWCLGWGVVLPLNLPVFFRRRFFYIFFFLKRPQNHMVSHKNKVRPWIPAKEPSVFSLWQSKGKL